MKRLTTLATLMGHQTLSRRRRQATMGVWRFPAVVIVLGMVGLGAWTASPAAAQPTVLTHPDQFSGTETVIDFEGYTNVYITNQYAGLGVYFSADVGNPPVAVDDTAPRQFGPPGWSSLANYSNNVILTFTEPQNRVAFEIRTMDDDDLILTLQFIASGQVVGNHLFFTDLSYQFVGLESAEPFDQVIIDVTETVAGIFRLDNLRFEPDLPPVCQITNALHESATLGETGVPYGTSISRQPGGPDQFLGTRFSVSQTVDVSAIGGNLRGSGFGNGMIFGAILALNGPDALPQGNPFAPGEVIAATAFAPDPTGSDIRAPLSATLTPGTYALVFGTNDYGATGQASSPATGDPIPGTHQLIWDGNGWIDLGDYQLYFVVEAEAALAEGQAATTSLLLDASRSYDPEGQPLLYAWSTDCPGGSFDDPASATPLLTVDTSGLCPDGVACTATLVVEDANAWAECSTAVSIADTTPPELTVPGDITIDCAAAPNPPATGGALAVDAYDQAPLVTYTDEVTPGACENEAVITRTWKATDSCGNFSTATQTITVEDSTGPELTVPVDITVECDQVPEPAVVTATDNCDPAPVVEFTETELAGACLGEYTLNRSWTATDSCGNSTTGLQVVSVLDSAAPVLDCPADAPALECPADTSETALGSATGTDACSDVSISSNDQSAAGCGVTETITRTWTATDDCGNQAACVQMIATVDTTPPVLTVDTTPIAAVDEDCSGDEPVTLPAATAEDQCDGVVDVVNDAPALFPAGETTAVSFVAEDGCGNAASAQTEVTVAYGANINVWARKFVVGLGHHPGVNRCNLVGITVGAYDLSPDSCAWYQLENCPALRWALPDLLANCTPLSTAVTDADGRATINVPPGDYIVASHFDSDDDGELDMYLGRYTMNLACGGAKYERLFMIQVNTGKRFGCKWSRLTGSELLIVEPEEVVWDEPEQLYPFVFDSAGDWDVTVTVAPPEGFVSDYDELSEDVVDETEAVQFTITEVGSDLVPTQTSFRVVHNGRQHMIHSEVGIRLTPDYARSRGFDVTELRSRGLIVEPQALPAQVKPRKKLEWQGAPALPQ